MSGSKNTRSATDALDRRILASLHRNGRISKTRMSEEVGLCATRCWERVRRMEEDGIIRGYHADIDLKQLAGLSLFLVQVRLHDSSLAHARRFERLIAGNDPIVGCHAVLGTVDYFLVIAASGIEGYQTIIESLSCNDGIEFEFVTFAISKTIKTPSSIPLPVILAHGS